MRIRPGTWPGRVFTCIGALALSLSTGGSLAADYAMQMDKAATSLLLDVAVAGERLVVVGERGHILYSDDNAESWVQAEVPTSVMLTRATFINDDLGFVVGHDGNVLVTRDGGTNWELQRHGMTDQALINEQRAGRAKENVADLEQQLSAADGDERDDLEMQLDDARYAMETALEMLDGPVYAPPLMSVWFHTESLGWISGAYGTLLHTVNGGDTWQDWAFNLDNPEELHLNGIAGSPDGNQLYIASEWGTVFRSLNAGQTWDLLETGYEGSFFGMVVSPTTGSVFAYGLLGTIYRSTDQGETWEELTSMARASLFGGHAAEDGTVVFVGQGGTAVRSTDDGNSFTPLVQPSRRGLHGVDRMADGNYAVAGDGGGGLLVMGGNPAPAHKTQSEGEAE